MVQCAITVGGPGAGKTTEALRLMDMALQTVRDPLQVGFVSFTKAARREAATRAGEKFGVGPDRLEKDGWFRTIHSVAYKCLGVQHGQLLTDNKESRTWLGNALQIKVEEGEFTTSGGFEQAFSDDEADADSPAATALALWDVARNRLEPYADVWHRADAVRRMPGLEKCTATVDRYEEAKGMADRLDFTDILLRFANRRATVDGCRHEEGFACYPELPVWFIDEAQDLSRLMDLCCQEMGIRAKWVYLSGDRMQCLAGDARIVTDRGVMTIRDAVNSRSQARVLSWNTSTGTAEYRQITGWHASPRGQRKIVEIGSLRLTEDHRVYSAEKGYVSAKEILNCNEQLIYWSNGENRTVRAREIPDRWQHSGGRLHRQKYANVVPTARDRAQRVAGGVPGLEISGTEKADVDAASVRLLANQFWWLWIFVFILYKVAGLPAAFLRRLSCRWRRQEGSGGGCGHADAAGHSSLVSGRRHKGRIPGEHFYMRLFSCLSGDSRQSADQTWHHGSGAKTQTISENPFPCGTDASAVRYYQGPRSALHGLQNFRRSCEKTDTVPNGDPEIFHNARAASAEAVPLLREAIHRLAQQKVLRSTGLQEKAAGGKLCTMEEKEKHRGDSRLLNLRESVHPNGSIFDFRGAVNVLGNMQGEADQPESRQERNHEHRAQESDDGTVYCIDVEDNHNFFAEGVLVHNCLYNWSGADAGAFMSWPVEGRVRYLPKSYRCPAKVLDVVKAIGRRCDEWTEVPFDDCGRTGAVGRIAAISEIRRVVKATEDTLVLARTNFLAKRLGAELTRASIPWRWTRGGQAAAKVRCAVLFMRLRRGETIDADAWALLAQHTPSKWLGQEMLVRGTKKRFEDTDEIAALGRVRLDTLLSLPTGATTALHDAVRAGQWAEWIEDGKTTEVFAGNHGEELALRPMVRVGTVHSAKGAEAKHCVLWSALTRTVEAACRDSRQANDERKVWYVGASRASERLTVIDERAPHKFQVM